MGEPNQPPQYQPLPGWYQAAYPLPPQPHFVHPAALSRDNVRENKEREDEVVVEDEEVVEEVHYRGDLHDNIVGEEESRRRDDDEDALQLAEDFLAGTADPEASIISPSCINALRDPSDIRCLSTLSLSYIVTRIVKKVVQKAPGELIFSKQMFIRNNWLSKQTYALGFKAKLITSFLVTAITQYQMLYTDDSDLGTLHHIRVLPRAFALAKMKMPRGPGDPEIEEDPREVTTLITARRPSPNPHLIPNPIPNPNPNPNDDLGYDTEKEEEGTVISLSSTPSTPSTISITPVIASTSLSTTSAEQLSPPIRPVKGNNGVTSVNGNVTTRIKREADDFYFPNKKRASPALSITRNTITTNSIPTTPPQQQQQLQLQQHHLPPNNLYPTQFMAMPMHIPIPIPLPLPTTEKETWLLFLARVGRSEESVKSWPIDALREELDFQDFRGARKGDVINCWRSLQQQQQQQQQQQFEKSAE